MKPLIFFSLATLLCLFGMSSCTPKSQLRQEINHLESLAEKEPVSDSVLVPLMQNYANYAQLYDKDKMAPIYLYKMAVNYYRAQNLKQAALELEKIIDQYQKSEAYPKALIFAATLYEEHLSNPELSATYYKTYLEKFPEGEGKDKAAFFFQPEDVKIRSQIAELQNTLQNNKQKEFDKRSASLLVRNYLTYVQRFPNSEFSPIYCFEGGRLASSLGETAEAVELWLSIYEQYYDFRYYPESLLLLAVEIEHKIPLYLQGFNKKDALKARTYSRLAKKNFDEHNYLKEAEKLYKEFIAKYPNHELAKQAKASLKYLGKDPNDVVQEFKTNIDKLHQKTQ